MKKEHVKRYFFSSVEMLNEQLKNVLQQLPGKEYLFAKNTLYLPFEDDEGYHIVEIQRIWLSEQHEVFVDIIEQGQRWTNINLVIFDVDAPWYMLDYIKPELLEGLEGHYPYKVYMVMDDELYDEAKAIWSLQQSKLITPEQYNKRVEEFTSQHIGETLVRSFLTESEKNAFLQGVQVANGGLISYIFP